MEEGIPVSSGNAITRCISRIKKLNLGMNFYKIIGRGNDCHWINLKSIIFVEFDDDLKEIIFDGMIRIMMDEKNYAKTRKMLLKEMFKLL